MRLTRLIALCLLLLPWVVEGSNHRVLILAGWVLSNPPEPPLERVTLLVENGVLTSIDAGYNDLDNYQQPFTVVDLRDAFVLPGFIDLHVHLTSPAEPGGDLRVVTETAADLALTALELGQRNLAAGFTTVVDLGTGRLAHEEAIYALRDAVAAGRAVGPRIIAAGSPLSPTGASRTGKYRAEVEAAIPPPGICDGADDCRRVVREQVARGADIINVYNSGSLNDSYIAEQTFTDEEFEAIVESAHALGRRVIADGHTAGGINAALRAGADIIDTAPWPDEESWALLHATGAAFVPHLFAFERVVGDTPEALNTGTMHWIPSPIMQRLYAIKSEPYSAVRAYREGITIAFGSDTGVIPHGTNAGEFTELVKIGMTPAQTIATATSNAARVLGLGHLVGSLAPGKAADIVAVASNPLDDISVLERVRFVMKSGRIFRADIGLGPKACPSRKTGFRTIWHRAGRRCSRPGGPIVKRKGRSSTVVP